MDFDFDLIKKTVGVAGAVIAAVSGGVTLSGKLGWGLFDRPILEWSAEHFEISDGMIEDGFKVVVARQKLRDDCEVTGFTVEIRDSDFVVFPATPSVTKFSGPASDKVDRFGYYVFFQEMDSHKVATGEATLLGQVKYKCPEGQKIVTYPDHENLRFIIEGI